MRFGKRRPDTSPLTPGVETPEEPLLGVSGPSQRETAAENPGSADDVAAPASLGRIEETLARIALRLIAGSPAPDHQHIEELCERLSGLPEQIDTLGQSISRELDDRLNRLADTLIPPACEESDLLGEPDAIEEPTPFQTIAVPEGGNEAWERCLLGDELCQQPELADVRRMLLEDVLAGNGQARALVGQLMLVQSASAEQMPDLMKSVGEAYYRWRSRTAAAGEPLELALAQWLTKCAAALGLGNTVELVRPGTRFDATRHAAAERGVEITGVHGWVIVRNTGKVYARASVSVK